MAKPVKKTTVRKKRKERKNIERGQAHIQATFNNTIVTLTDMSGNALLGPAQVLWALRDRESPLLSLRRALLK